MEKDEVLINSEGVRYYYEERRGRGRGSKLNQVEREGRQHNHQTRQGENMLRETRKDEKGRVTRCR